MRYIAVVRAAGGRIVSYRDYWNPLAMSPPADATKPA
jgi:ketosteroid isomerase-like protein